MYKNVLITGGAGFIGSTVALKLLKQGYHVTVLDSLSKQIHGENPKKSELFQRIDGKVDFILGDVKNKEDWRKALKGQDVVIHLAAETGTGQSMYDIDNYIETNIGGTSHLFDILTNDDTDVKKVLIASSRAIYGEGRYLCPKDGYVYPTERKDEDMQKKDFEVKCPICGGEVELVSTTEDSKLQPTSTYGLTKEVQEELGMMIGKSIGIPVVVYRYQNVYGPGQSLKNPYTGILSIFSTIIKNGNSINIFEDGHETRDFVYIDDVADATILGIENPKADYQIFNVGTGIKTDVLTVANTLIEKYGIKVPVVVSGNYRLGDIRHNFADISNIQNKLGFQPKVDFKEGISRFADWVNKQEVEKDNYKESIEEMRKKGLYK
ncbi:MAG: SDR family NAD(P)-dependent oxidoreductase [Enterococcaceae bacterium]|jgi:dTDP-L-rhamnose 4-epimerase|nr:SDR family NAD(P)-dependent oxidoreductase [Enterococcaceae bacterium]MCI1918802.1 SDR family NAD(P)-dependent oxidoreductase [Enterococcaceae bacterium]